MSEMVASVPKREPRAETTRMFESDFFEWFSRIHPSVPFIAWIPVMSFVLYRSYSRHILDFLSTAALFALGALIWSLTEYLLHRFVFHWTRDTAFGRRLHFLVHGVHHDYPNDKDRLVMPLGASIPIGILFYLLYYFTVGPVLGEPIYAGMALGYMAYDGTHYAVHHFRPRTRLGRYVRRHHMLHHHLDHSGGFGVSSPLWDLILGTMPTPKRKVTAATEGTADVAA
jgi:sterol desaturase/sphingolipid hydroxylase (fatty acid hydroxylase superfamily)